MTNKPTPIQFIGFLQHFQATLAEFVQKMNKQHRPTGAFINVAGGHLWFVAKGKGDKILGWLVSPEPQPKENDPEGGLHCAMTAFISSRPCTVEAMTKELEAQGIKGAREACSYTHEAEVGDTPLIAFVYHALNQLPKVNPHGGN